MELIAYEAYMNRNNLIERAKYPITLGGWFDKPSRLRDYAKRFTNVSAYVSINPVAKYKLAHTYNRVNMLTKGDPATKADIVRIDHLYIDIDAAKPDPKISSTASELDDTLDVRGKILAKYSAIADNAIWGCTGNGDFILAKVGGLPNTPETAARHRELLAALARGFDRPGGPRVDTNTFYANVHIGLPGTRKTKGEDMPDRPWRSVVVDGGNF